MSIQVVDFSGGEPVVTGGEELTGGELGGSPGVSAEGKARATADEAAAAAAGFSLAPPVYEIGRVVNSMGVENFRQSRKDYEDMPTLSEACANLITTVQAEKRTDQLVALPDLSMLDDGQLTRGAGQLTLSKRGLLGLASFATPGGGSYLASCEPALRAHNLNHWFEKGYRDDMVGFRSKVRDWEQLSILAARHGQPTPAYPTPDKVPQEVTLRTRINRTQEGREVFATVGPRYGAFDIDKVAELVLDSVPTDSRCDIVYDGYKARINVLFHTDVQPEKSVAGEIFKAGVVFKMADDGTGSIQSAAEVWRNLCLNLIIIDHDRQMTSARRHIGTEESIRAAVKVGIAAAYKRIEYFAEKWSAATLENVVDKYGCDINAIFRGLVANKVVHVPNVRPEDTFKRLLAAWQVEPGYSRTAIVNAVTRMAHTETWPTWTAVEDLERLGGELLFAPDWTVAIPEKEQARLTF